LDLLHSMPSVLSNVRSDYLPAEGFNQGGQGSIQRVAEVASKTNPGDILLHHPELPRIQYYATNVALDCTYVSPLCEQNLEGVCPMLVVSVGNSLKVSFLFVSYHVYVQYVSL
jgi:hypothetical protein